MASGVSWPSRGVPRRSCDCLLPVSYLFPAESPLTPGGNGTRTPVRPRTPNPAQQQYEKEDSPTISDAPAKPTVIEATKIEVERADTPDYIKAQYVNMSGMSSW